MKVTSDIDGLGRDVVYAIYFLGQCNHRVVANLKGSKDRGPAMWMLPTERKYCVILKFKIDFFKYTKNIISLLSLCKVITQTLMGLTLRF